ncbi:hypothetical protein D3C87_1191390 [compost metagenome]
MHHRDLDRSARAAALVGKAQVALGVDRFAVVIAKAQGVDHGGGVFDLAISADHSGFAVGLDFFRTADDADQTFNHQRAEVGAVGTDLRFEVFNETVAHPWVFHHHGEANHGHGFVSGFAAFDKSFFDIADDLANFETHELLRWGIKSVCASDGIP